MRNEVISCMDDVNFFLELSTSKIRRSKNKRWQRSEREAGQLVHHFSDGHCTERPERERLQLQTRVGG